MGNETALTTIKPIFISMTLKYKNDIHQLISIAQFPRTALCCVESCWRRETCFLQDAVQEVHRKVYLLIL